MPVLISNLDMASPSEEYDFVESELSDDYFCPVTYELLKDPRQTYACCGKHISREVADRLEREKRACPLCNVGPLKTSPDLYFQRRVLDLRVRCPNKRYGCDWEGELRDVEKHLNTGNVDGECTFTLIDCPCGQELQRQKYREHISSKCVQRTIKCLSCQYEDTYEVLTKHPCPQCQTCNVPCPNMCPAIVKSNALQLHLAECLLQEIECQYSYANCQTKVKRNEMQKHLDVSKDEHLALVDTYARDLTTRLEALGKEIDGYRAQTKESNTSAFTDTFPVPHYYEFIPQSSYSTPSRPSRALRIIDPATREEVNVRGSTSNETSSHKRL